MSAASIEEFEALFLTYHQANDARRAKMEVTAGWKFAASVLEQIKDGYATQNDIEQWHSDAIAALQALKGQTP